MFLPSNTGLLVLSNMYFHPLHTNLSIAPNCVFPSLLLLFDSCPLALLPDYSSPSTLPLVSSGESLQAGDTTAPLHHHQYPGSRLGCSACRPRGLQCYCCQRACHATQEDAQTSYAMLSSWQPSHTAQPCESWHTKSSNTSFKSNTCVSALCFSSLLWGVLPWLYCGQCLPPQYVFQVGQ